MSTKNFIIKQIKLLEDQIATPVRYPDLFIQEFSEYLDNDRHVKILHVYYDTLEVLKAADPQRYKSLLEGFILDVLPDRPSSVIEDLKDDLEILKEELQEKNHE